MSPQRRLRSYRSSRRHCTLFRFDGVTGAFLASRLLLRHYLDEVDPADEAFGFTR